MYSSSSLTLAPKPSNSSTKSYQMVPRSLSSLRFAHFPLGTICNKELPGVELLCCLAL
mgnify:CR=1 FL=1|jgi:hypothetical protein